MGQVFHHAQTAADDSNPFSEISNWFLFLAPFIPGVQHVADYLTENIRITPVPFRLLRLCRCLHLVYGVYRIGYILGAQWENVFRVMHR